MFDHYFKPCPFDQIDIYRVIDLFGVTDPCLQHALKKILVTGGRGHKDAAQDVAEAIASLQRWQQMRYEEADTGPTLAPEVESAPSAAEAAPPIPFDPSLPMLKRPCWDDAPEWATHLLYLPPLGDQPEQWGWAKEANVPGVRFFADALGASYRDMNYWQEESARPGGAA